MTAYLQQGDKIHLVLPPLGPWAKPEDITRYETEMRNYYAAHGVQVTCTTISAAATIPVVVSVFRDDVAEAAA